MRCSGGAERAVLRIETVSPVHPDARRLLDGAADVLKRITGSDGRASFQDWLDDDRHVFLLARENSGAAVGCGGVRPLQPGVGEIKRMYAAQPGLGIGAALLAALEVEARARGYRELWCETRRVNEAAVRFYKGRGYAVRDNYGRYAGRSEAVCFNKAL